LWRARYRRKILSRYARRVIELVPRSSALAGRSSHGHGALQALHHFREARQIQRLRSVGQGALRAGVDFDDQAVRANGYCRACCRRD